MGVILNANGFVLPSPLPATWTGPIHGPFGGQVYEHNGLSVMISVDEMKDGKRWLHLSAARRSRLPSWEELVVVKNLFIGLERPAYQVLPKQSEYVNLHPYALHLWYCLDGDPFPEFKSDKQGAAVCAPLAVEAK